MRNAFTKALITFLLLAGGLSSRLSQSLAAPQPEILDGFIGAQQCGTCHPAKLSLQAKSEHAHALSRPADHALAAQFAPDRTFLRGGKYAFRFSQDADGLHLRAWSDSQEISMPVEWAFGAGSQAVTFSSRADSDWYLEHALSYYSASRSYSTTPGQSVLPDDSFPFALGKMFRSDDAVTGVLHCFQCHSTGPVARDDKGELHPHELGVRCESCHGPGQAHRDAGLQGDAARAKQLIQNPRRMSAGDMNRFCGNCHRPPAAAGTAIDWSISWNVRHQPVYLNEAACFRKSQGALTCLTCHDPHAELNTDANHYNAACASCHSANHNPPAKTCLSSLPANCVDCHMPRISPQSNLRFTNHWIGVYAANDKLRPTPRK